MKPFDLSQNRPMRIAVLISGTGRTLRNLLQRVASGQLHAEIPVVIASTPSARGLQYAEKAAIPLTMVERKDFASLGAYGEAIFRHVRAAGADLVILAGFFRRIVVPDDFVNHVVAIHPSLIPAFCGRGFYSHRVHEAVLEYGVKVTGCTVHFIDNEYDHGPVILQMDVPVLEGDTLDSLEARVFATECEAFPKALELIAEGRVSVEGRRVKIAPAPPPK